MIPVAIAAITGGTLYVGAKAYQAIKSPKKVAFLKDGDPAHHKIRPAQTDQPWSEGDTLSEQTEKTLALSFPALENRFHRFIQTSVDRLLGQTRRRQLQEIAQQPLAGSLEDLSEMDRVINRGLGLAAFLTGAALVGQIFLSPLTLAVLLSPIAYTIVLPVAQGTYQALVKERRLTLDVIISLYAVATWFGGFLVSFGLSMLLVLLSQKLIAITEDRSRKNLVNVFGQQPRHVWVLMDDYEVKVPFDKVQPGDRVVVRAGQVVPVDGLIVQGAAIIDQHMLTGEAQPAEKGLGNPVFAATVVLAGDLQIQVAKAGQETVAAQIGAILNRTAGYQMALESKGIEVANRTAWPRLLLSGLAWPTVGVGGAVAILGCGIGTNIKIAAPLTMLNYLNLITHQGILVKDGRSLELLPDIDTVIFDKTGTLTIAQPRVSHVHALNGLSEETLLGYAAAAEAHQSHPIATAILAEANRQGLDIGQIDQAHYEIGYGIKVIAAYAEADKTIHVGSERYMVLEDIELPPALQDRQAACQAAGHSLVCVAVDHAVVGAIELEPTLRPEAKAVIEALRQRGLSLAIISGDQEQPTRTLAQALGIDHYYANTLPEDKADLVAQLQSEGRSVCFIGDGINDAIALKKAQVSISLRGATPIATDTAQIVLMDQTLKQLPQLFDLAQDFKANLRTGFRLAIIPGVLFIGGVFLFHLGIYASLVVYNLSLAGSLGNAMLPLLSNKDQAD